MSDQYVGEIRIFGGNYAPQGWAQCNGQLLPVRQNTALFSLLGTNYGGDGRSNFGLPNLQGRAALNQGQAAGEVNYFVGQTGGEASVPLTIEQMAAHNHTATGSLTSDNASPSGLTWANLEDRPAPEYFTDAAGTPQSMSPSALNSTGGNQPHNNLMPYQALNFCIALQGNFPSRP